MANRLWFLSVVVVLASACPGLQRSTARIDEVKYRPDNGGDIIEWRYDYDGDGFLTGIEKEVGGNETLDISYSYDDRGQVASVEYDGGTDEVVFNISYEDGLLTSAVAEVEYRDDLQNLDIETTVEFTMTYLDGRLAERVDTEETVAVRDEGLLPVRITTDNETTRSYAWGDDGRLNKVIYDEREDRKTDWEAQLLPDEESATRVDAETRYTYDDQGQLTDIELDQETDVDGVETNTTLDTELKFDEEARLTDVEETLRAGDNTFDDEFTLEYDEEGRVVRIEDEDGNRWDVDYVDGDVQRLTLAMPAGFAHAENFDLAGHFFGEFSLEHVGLP